MEQATSGVGRSRLFRNWSKLKPILVTGAAGFIGAAVSKRLLDQGWNVIGIDNLNSYYPVNLKLHRLTELQLRSNFHFHQLDISNTTDLSRLTESCINAPIVHLAAQAGVRNSIQDPQSYVWSNLVGFANMMEFARSIESPHFVYASTSSVYGLNAQLPYVETQSVRHPLNLYSATKIANEAVAHSYSHLFSLPTTGLRFFTVYGPAGRPDMAPFIFVRKTLQGEKIPLFNGGHGTRDFTYIDDIVDAVVALIPKPAAPDQRFSRKNPNPATSTAPFRVFNVGSGQPARVTDFLAALESSLGCTVKTEVLPAQDGDMDATHADTSALRIAIGWTPKTSLAAGVDELVRWCRSNPSLIGD